MSNVAVINPENKANITAGGRVSAIIPQSMDDAYRLGKAIIMSGTAPRGMDTPEKCMIAIMRGLEVGLSPMQAVDKIAIVNGRPVIWGDGAIGLVRGSGLCEYVHETAEGVGDDRAAVCVVKRRGEPKEVVRRFSITDARKAGLWGKSGPWSQYPDRMLQMRARAFALRDVFADVLGGLYLREEIDDADGDRKATKPPSPKAINPPSPPSPPSPKAIAEQPESEAETDAEFVNPEDVFADAEGQLCVVQDIGTWEEVWANFQHYQEVMFPPDWDHLVSIGLRHRERVGG